MSDESSALLDSIDPAKNSWGGAPPAAQMSIQDQADKMLDSIDPRVSGWDPIGGSAAELERDRRFHARRGTFRRSDRRRPRRRLFRSKPRRGTWRVRRPGWRPRGRPGWRRRGLRARQRRD